MSQTTDSLGPEFVDRRVNETSPPPGAERRQFANSYGELSPDARELALAIDRYKIMHRRRFINCEELLGVVRSLGYERTEAVVEQTTTTDVAAD